MDNDIAEITVVNKTQTHPKITRTKSTANQEASNLNKRKLQQRSNSTIGIKNAEEPAPKKPERAPEETKESNLKGSQSSLSDLSSEDIPPPIFTTNATRKRPTTLPLNRPENKPVTMFGNATPPNSRPSSPSNKPATMFGNTTPPNAKPSAPTKNVGTQTLPNPPKIFPTQPPPPGTSTAPPPPPPPSPPPPPLILTPPPPPGSGGQTDTRYYYVHVGETSQLVPPLEKKYQMLKKQMQLIMEYTESAPDSVIHASQKQLLRNMIGVNTFVFNTDRENLYRDYLNED